MIRPADEPQDELRHGPLYLFIFHSGSKKIESEATQSQPTLLTRLKNVDIHITFLTIIVIILNGELQVKLRHELLSSESKLN